MNLENAKVTKIGLGEESSKIGWGVYENAKVTKLENAKVTKLETAKVTKIAQGGSMKMQKL